MLRKKSKQSLFFAAKNERVAKSVDISSPYAFHKSKRELMKGYYTESERRAIQLAVNRAKAQLHRKDLSVKERKQFGKIARARVPKRN